MSENSSEPASKRLKLSDDARVCERFSAADSDLTLESSDKVLFKVHRNNLSVHSCIFPGAEISTNDEIVTFSEESKVLELLLQHIYPSAAPDMDALDFATLLKLADAAEKYHIFSVMEICRLHMKSYVDQKPLEVFCYACKYGYNTLSDKTALMTIDTEPSAVLGALGSQHFVRWILYRETWLKAYHQFSIETTASLPLPSSGFGHNSNCMTVNTRMVVALTAYHKRRTRLRDLKTIKANFSPVYDLYCEICTRRWMQKLGAIEALVASLPAFSRIRLPF